MAIQLDGTTGISTSGNITVAGALVVGTFAPTSLSASGNVTGGNLNTTGALSVGGNSVITGDLTVVGNASLSGNIIGDKITNGTTSVEIPVANGNVSFTVGGTNVVIVSTTGEYVTGEISAGGNVTGSNLNATNLSLIANVISAINSTFAITTSANVLANNVIATNHINASGNISGGNVLPSGQLSAIGNVTGGNLLTSGIVSTPGNITGANVLTGGLINATGNVTGGNITTGGTLSSAGNITTGGTLSSAGNIIAPAVRNSAGNSQISFTDSGSVSANIVLFQQGANGNVTIRVGESTTEAPGTFGLFSTGQIGASGNIIGSNLNAAGLSLSSNVVSALNSTSNITTTANITGGYFLGNGSLLTGIDATSIQNGTSNVRVVSSGGNVAISVGGTSNVAVYDTTGEYVTGLISATSNVVTTANISGGYILGNGSLLTGIDATSIQNGTSNVRVVSSGGNVAIGVGGTGNVAVYATTGEYVTGLISATGNITAGNLSGTSIVGTLTTAAQTNITSVGTLTSLAVTGNTTSGNVLTGGLISATGNINSGNVIPTNQVILPNGTAALPSLVFDKGGTNLGLYNNMGTLYFAFNSANRSSINNDRMHAVGVTNTAAGPVLAVQSTNTGFFTENSNNTLSITATATHVASFNNITASNSTTTGAIVSMGGIGAAGNIYAGGLISATGNITGGNILGGANVNATTHTGTTVSVTANVTGGNVLTGGVVSATGNVTGGNVLGGTVSVSANITGGNILTGGLISATGNITGGNVNTNNIVGTGLTLVSTGDLTLSTTGNINANNEYINNVPQPQQNADAATKQYVDNLVSTAISYHSPVVAATITTLATATGGVITYAQPNGVANGVGATLTTTGSFDLIDTANIQTIGTRVLVKDEGNAVFNGVYTWANTTAIVRATDADTYGAGSATQLGINDYFFVQSGNVNAGAAYIVNAPVGTITFGTSNISFAEFSKSQIYSANTSAGISLNGTVINALVDNVTTAFSTGNIVVKASANLTTPNIGAATGTSLSVTGNITGGNLLTGGLISSTGTITSSANITGGNLLTGGLISSTGNVITPRVIVGTDAFVSGAVFSAFEAAPAFTVGSIFPGGVAKTIGNASLLTWSTAGEVNTGFAGTSVFFFDSSGNSTMTATPQTGEISSTGNVSGGNLYTFGNIQGSNVLFGIGNVSGSGNIIGGNVLGGANVNATIHTGTTVSVTGNITGGNFVGTLNGSGANVTSISATNISSGTLAQARLANASLTVNGTSIALGGSGTVTATATNALTIGTGLGGTSYNGSTGVTITNTGVTSVTAGTNIAVSAATGGVTISVTGTVPTATSATTAATVTTAAQPNITSVGTLSSLTVSGNSTQANINLTTNTTSIRQTSTTVWSGDAASGQGKLEYHSNRWYVNAGGDSTLVCQFRRGGTDVASVDNSGVYSGTATTAKYADLAENYSADDVYAPGTVLVFGGANEVTVANMISDPKVAGVVSTNPAHLMNSVMEAEHTVAVALTGRVPTKVIGPVKKGDMMVSSINGRAQACATPAMGTVIGKALQDFDGESGTIEIVVGRL